MICAVLKSPMRPASSHKAHIQQQILYPLQIEDMLDLFWPCLYTKQVYLPKFWAGRQAGSFGSPLAAEVTESIMPQTAKPAITPLFWPAQAANAKMHSLPYSEDWSQSVRPAPYALATCRQHKTPSMTQV